MAKRIQNFIEFNSSKEQVSTYDGEKKKTNNVRRPQASSYKTKTSSSKVKNNSRLYRH